MYKTTFTSNEDNFIKENYLTMPIKSIANKLNRSGCGVRGRLKAMNLFIPKELAEKRKKESQFKKGNIPYSKGKKMSKSQYDKCKKTMFKKGHEPHTTLHDGIITVRKDKRGIPYQFIRLSKANWEPFHINIWKKNNGEMPKGHIVIFKDGNSMNCTIENLECISKAENMLRNSKHDFPKEIIPTKLLINKLNKKIKDAKEQIK